MSTASFIGYDLVTGPDWQTAGQERGTAGYSLSDSSATTLVESLPAYITSVDWSAFSWAGAGNSPLTRPGGGAPLYGRYYTIGATSGPVNATDGASHYLSIYCADDVGTGRTQAINILDASDAPLASHTINYNFEGGVWVCFLVSGVVKVQLQVLGGSANAVVSGVTWDETQPPKATAGAGGLYSPSGGMTLGGASANVLAASPSPSGGMSLGGAVVISGGGGATTGFLEVGDSAMAHMGDLGGSQVITLPFWTSAALTSGAAGVLRDDGVASTSGVTLSLNRNATTGRNAVVVDVSDKTFYLDDHDYEVSITAGTVGGTSAVGLVGSFSIRNRPLPVKSTSFDTSGIHTAGG
jgi:hypothetical protein